MSVMSCIIFFFFFFNDTATTEIYTLSLHDALPICWTEKPELLEEGIQPTARPKSSIKKPVAVFGAAPRVEGFSVREALANRHILLVGVTGFIGKVWLVDLLEKIPNIGKITLLIRRNRTTSAQRRF